MVESQNAAGVLLGHRLIIGLLLVYTYPMRVSGTDESTSNSDYWTIQETYSISHIITVLEKYDGAQATIILTYVIDFGGRRPPEPCHYTPHREGA